MAYFLLRRVGETLVTLVLITILVFCLARLTGDPTLLLLPPDSTDAQRAYFRTLHGLDRSWFEQYVIFMGNLAVLAVSLGIFVGTLSLGRGR